MFLKLTHTPSGLRVNKLEGVIQNIIIARGTRTNK